jgi:DNA-binding CsgD family transcriptional regulator
LREDSPGILAIADEMMEVARGSNEHAYLDAMRHGGVALYEQGRLREAEPRFRRAFDEARRRALPAVEVRTAGYLARTLLVMGRPAEASDLLDGCEATWHRLKSSAYVSVHSQLPRIRAEIAAVRGGWEDACGQLERIAAGERDPHARLQVERRLLDNLARGGGRERSADVVRHLEAARASSKEAGCPNCAADLRLEAIEALVRAGRVVEARESFDSVAAEGDTARRERPRASPRSLRYAWVAALLDVAEGRANAIEALCEVVGTAERSDQIMDSLWARLDLARAQAAVDRDGAIDTLGLLIEAAERVGASTHVGLAERELRALGVRSWRRGPRRGTEGAAALSERELSVARMAASGASNPEIARVLYVSRKTVEHHMSSVLAKLGARNRTELAALWIDEMREQEPES